jgi:hypothetical protein
LDLLPNETIRNASAKKAGRCVGRIPRPAVRLWTLDLHGAIDLVAYESTLSYRNVDATQKRSEDTHQASMEAPEKRRCWKDR